MKRFTVPTTLSHKSRTFKNLIRIEGCKSCTAMLLRHISVVINIRCPSTLSPRSHTSIETAAISATDGIKKSVRKIGTPKSSITNFLDPENNSEQQIAHNIEFPGLIS